MRTHMHAHTQSIKPTPKNQKIPKIEEKPSKLEKSKTTATTKCVHLIEIYLASYERLSLYSLPIHKLTLATCLLSFYCVTLFFLNNGIHFYFILYSTGDWT